MNQEKEIPTAEDILLKDEGYKELSIDYPKLHDAIKNAMIEFAKLHVKAYGEFLEECVNINLTIEDMIESTQYTYLESNIK